VTHINTDNASNMVKAFKLPWYDDHLTLSAREPQSSDSGSNSDDEDQVLLPTQVKIYLYFYHSRTTV